MDESMADDKDKLASMLKRVNLKIARTQVTNKQANQLIRKHYIDVKYEPNDLIQLAWKEKLNVRETLVNRLNAIQEIRDMEMEEKRMAIANNIELKKKKKKRKRATTTNKSKKTRVDALKEKSYKREYAVETLLKWEYDSVAKQLKYLVKWEGFESDSNTWEFDFRLDPCPDVINNYLISCGIELDIYNSEDILLFQDILNKVGSKQDGELCLLWRLNEKSLVDIKLENKNDFDSKMKKLRENILYYHQMIIKNKWYLMYNKLEDKEEDSEDDYCLLFKLNNIIKFICEKLMITKQFGTLSRFLQFYKDREEMKIQLKESEDKINEKLNGKNQPKIIIENNVDAEKFPDFDYIDAYETFHRENPEEPQRVGNDVIHACECKNCYLERDYCCTAVVGFRMSYNSQRLLRLTHKNDKIFECNSKCKCDSECPNRVVQNGTKCKLAVFKTENRGWGVKTLEPIPKGSFVLEYVGELITMEEAELRPTTYLFDLDNKLDSSVGFVHSYYVDASKRGNIGRLVNHACTNVANMRVLFVWTDSYNNYTPHIAFFATRAIKANEEITYDYGMELVDAVTDYDDEVLEPFQLDGFRNQDSDEDHDSGISTDDGPVNGHAHRYADAESDSESESASTIGSNGESILFNNQEKKRVKKVPTRNENRSYNPVEMRCLCHPDCKNIIFI